MSQLALAPSNPPGLRDDSCICEALAQLGGVGVLVTGSAIPFCVAFPLSHGAAGGVRNDTFIASFSFGILQKILTIPLQESATCLILP